MKCFDLNKGLMREFRLFLVATAVAFALEIGVFNVSYWTSLTAVSSGTYAFEFSISLVRICFLLGAFVLYRVFRPDSPIWMHSLDLSIGWQRRLTAALCVLLCVFVVAFGRLSDQAEWIERGPTYEDGIQHVQDGNQYNYLADALLSGSVCLDLPVSDILLEMENPYDTSLRMQLNEAIHDPIYWDYAFYEGSYYCYFGVVPCLMTFLPFKALTGDDLRTDYAVSLFACAVIVVAFALLYQLKLTYFKKLSFGAYITGVLLYIFACGVFEQAFLPRIYPIPILSALLFASLGLCFWFRAKQHFNDGQQSPIASLALGGFFLACTLGCRPQFVLGCLLAFPLFWTEIKRGLFFSRSGLANTVSVMLPFVIVALPLCYYNYVRFDSPFNFGASYNLTGADMTSYQFIPQRIVAQVAEYLFLPLLPSGSFPYISAVNETWLSSTSLWTNEPYYAGFVFLTPATLVLFLLFSRTRRSGVRERGLLGYALVSVVVTFILLVVASYVSGVNMRYFADFAWLLILPATIVWWDLAGDVRACSSNGVMAAMSAMTFAGFVLYSWTFLGIARFGALIGTCPTLYYAIRGAVMVLR